MASLKGITQADPVSYTATLGSESVTVTFDSARMTGRWERDVNRALKEDDNETVSDLLFGVFIGWDVVDEQGHPVPLTTEILLDLPSKALVSLLSGMQEAVGPSSEEGNDSRNTSSSATTDSSSMPASLQNGQSLSPTPEPVASPSSTPPT